MSARSAFIAQENFIFINLSGQSLANAQFLLMIIVLITQTNIDASKTRFDITENTAVPNLSAANTFIAVLKNLRCWFSLDDFGSGLSSFEYLKK